MKHREHFEIVAITCMEVRKLSAEYLDGNLGFDAYIRVDAHLEHCSHCSAIYDGVRNVMALLASNEFLQVPNGLDERLLNALLEPDENQGN